MILISKITQNFNSFSFTAWIKRKHLIWPNAWKKTRWDFYDIGLLPLVGAWVNRWKASSINSEANPKKGV